MNLLTCIIVSLIILTVIMLTAFLSYFILGVTTSSSTDADTKLDLSLNPINGFSLSYVNTLNVLDQGVLKSCGAVQIASIMSYYYYIQLNNSISISALYLYYYGRMLNGGNINVDNGSSIESYLTSINSFGLTTEDNWPYITNKFNTRPLNNITIYNPELRWNTESTNITNIKHSIKSGNPVVLDILLYTSFGNSKTDTPGLVSMPNITNESYIARHAVSLWGWDDQYNVFIMLNSWGTNKGYNGWFFLPYEYILTPSLSNQYVYNISFIKDFNN